MSLDVSLEKVMPTSVYSANITHNLTAMAAEAGLYEALWRPEILLAMTAAELITHLAKGLARLESDPEHFRKLEPANGWGSYEGLVEFVRRYLAACKEHPDATVRVCR